MHPVQRSSLDQSYMQCVCIDFSPWTLYFSYLTVFPRPACSFRSIFIHCAFDLPELSSHIPYAAAETRGFQDAQIEIWQSFHSHIFFPVSPSSSLHSPPSFYSFTSPPLPPPPLLLLLHIFRYNYGGSLQMFLLRYEEMSRNEMFAPTTEGSENICCGLPPHR